MLCMWYAFNSIGYTKLQRRFSTDSFKIWCLEIYIEIHRSLFCIFCSPLTIILWRCRPFDIFYDSAKHAIVEKPYGGHLSLLMIAQGAAQLPCWMSWCCSTHFPCNSLIAKSISTLRYTIIQYVHEYSIQHDTGHYLACALRLFVGESGKSMLQWVGYQVLGSWGSAD